MSEPFPANRYFTGNFAPISFEADAADLPVRGELPAALRGTLYRNGPNPQFEPRGNLSLVHRRRHDPRLPHRGRQGLLPQPLGRTPKYEMEHAAGKRLFGTSAIR